MPFFDMSAFHDLASPGIKNKVKCNHLIKKGMLDSNSKVWICKKSDNFFEATREILAQEFFRVIIPHQPETRIAYDDKKQYYILSEEVNGYRALPTKQADNFENGTFTGLGQAMVCSLFLQEIDFKNGNVGLNAKQQVIKIDGDWCFSGLTDDFSDEKYNITLQSIEQLPYPVDYYAFNWLDLIQEDVKKTNSAIVNKTLSQKPLFRAEVNQALLKICLLPDYFIELFVQAYMPTEEQRFITLIKNRRDELKQSALKNASFNEYLRSPQALLDADNLLLQMQSFEAGGQLVISLKQQSALREKSLGLRNNLLPSFKQLIDDCNQFIKQLEFDISVNDTLLKRLIQETKDKMQTASEKELVEIKRNLAQTCQYTLSDEVVAIKKTIQTFREDSGFFSIGMKTKANKIEKALYNTPLEARQHLISSAKVNEVQKTLASHRHFFRRSPVKSSGDIDITQAANTFKQLKRQFSQQVDKEHKPLKWTFSFFKQGFYDDSSSIGMAKKGWKWW